MHIAYCRGPVGETTHPYPLCSLCLCLWALSAHLCTVAALPSVSQRVQPRFLFCRNLELASGMYPLFSRATYL